MPSVAVLRERLQKKLSALFQLDQPNLDFGFYRIMHARARQVEEFITRDLLSIVEQFRRNRSAVVFDTIYVNGINTLANLRPEGEQWSVRLIEREFMLRMWEAEG